MAKRRNTAPLKPSSSASDRCVDGRPWWAPEVVLRRPHAAILAEAWGRRGVGVLHPGGWQRSDLRPEGTAATSHGRDGAGNPAAHLAGAWDRPRPVLATDSRAPDLGAAAVRRKGRRPGGLPRARLLQPTSAAPGTGAGGSLAGTEPGRQDARSPACGRPEAEGQVPQRRGNRGDRPVPACKRPREEFTGDPGKDAPHC